MQHVYVSRTDHEREKAARRRILRNLAAGIADDDDDDGYRHASVFADWRQTRLVCKHCTVPWPCVAYERDRRAAEAALRAYWRDNGYLEPQTLEQARRVFAA